MSANRFGSHFVLTSFGESHGPALGAVIDGCPAEVEWDQALLNRELARRRPGAQGDHKKNVVSDRNETDAPEILSGVFENQTLGTPIAIMVRNQDARSQDYANLSPRAGHADDVWRAKFGHCDPRGGGRSSGRETLARVIGGSIAQMFLQKVAPALRATCFASSAGPFQLSENERDEFASQLRNSSRSEYAADKFVARFPSKLNEAALEKILLDAKASGKSYGGIAEIWIDGVPTNLGQPVFHKLKADFASAFMGVGATNSFELGSGFTAASAEGTDFHADSKGENYGGIRGGISTGERIVMRVGFKPTASVMDVAKKGRHDPFIIPRAVPVLEAMAYLVLAEHMLWMRSDRA